MGSSKGMMGKGPSHGDADRQEVGGMNSGKITKKTAVKSYFEGGAESYKPKGMKTRESSEE